MAKINIGNNSFSISKDGDTILLDGKPVSHSLVSNPDGSYHMILDNISYRVEVLEKDTSTGNLILSLNNRRVNTHLSNKLAELLKSMGMESGKKKLKELKAPMPGLVLGVSVKAGDEVVEGDELLILEAMKMENAIKSPQDGTIDSILVQKGDKVEKNQGLISFI
jgi:biotin carboxyl carrier protein